MKPLFQRYATPLTTGLFLVSLISGIFLFFGIAMRSFKEMHEILSMVLILPFALHIWRNWRPMTLYFKKLKRTPMIVALLVSLAWSGFYFYEAQQPSDGYVGGPPPFAMAAALAQQPLSAVAPALGIELSTISARLAAAGIADAGPSDSLAGLAAAAERDVFDLYGPLIGR